MDIDELEVTLKMLGIHYLKLVTDIYVNIEEFNTNTDLKVFFFKLLLSSNLSYQMIYFTDQSFGVYISKKKRKE